MYVYTCTVVVASIPTKVGFFTGAPQSSGSLSVPIPMGTTGVKLYTYANTRRMFNIVGERERPNLSAGCIKAIEMPSDDVKETLCHFQWSSSAAQYIY